MAHFQLKCILIFKLNIWIFTALLLLPIQINFWIFSYLTLYKRKLFFEHYNYGRNDTPPVHGQTKVVIVFLVLTHCTCATITLGSVRLFALTPPPIVKCTGLMALQFYHWFFPTVLSQVQELWTASALCGRVHQAVFNDWTAHGVLQTLQSTHVGYAGAVHRERPIQRRWLSFPPRLCAVRRI